MRYEHVNNGKKMYILHKIFYQCIVSQSRLHFSTKTISSGYSDTRKLIMSNTEKSTLYFSLFMYRIIA